jgi:uracil-DNA glycosylase family protein
MVHRWRQPGTRNGVTLAELAQEAAGCTACDLYRNATQTVFGEGGEKAELMLVGEQPGDREDIEGEPFVGPAGRLLDDALVAAGIDRADVYVTNAVKHFKWQPRGKRRIHQKPNATEVAACKRWLEAEIDTVRPELIVCLGATAAQALLGSSFRVTKQRGEVIESLDGRRITATVHPSSILRAPDEEARHREYELFVRDLKTAAAVLSR